MEHKRVEEMNAGRVASIAAPVLFPILEEGIRQEMEIMCRNFKQGHTDFIANVAKISTLIDLKKNFEQTIRKGETAASKIIKE